MLFKGINVKGVRFSGRRTLNTIGSVVFRFDYRYGLESINAGGVDAVSFWADLGPNNINLSQPAITGRLKINSDGVGSNGLYTLQYLKSAFNSHLNALHNGTPHLLYAVLRFNNPTEASQEQTLIRTYKPSVTAGMGLSLNATSNLISQQFRNSAGTGIGGTHSSTAGSILEDATYRLILYTYYGTGLTNNSNITIANTSYLSSRSPVFATTDASALLVNLTAGADLVRIKALGAYNLTGKTVIEIDAFIATFISTLKEDSEYSSLTTI